MMEPTQITGRHVLMIFGSAFAVIIAVNVLLAVKAVSTFPGLETRNSYVASQVFDRDRKAQEALRWTVSAEASGHQLVLRIDNEIGPVPARITQATLGRATHVNEDVVPSFSHDGHKFVATIPTLAPGNWNLRLKAVAPDGTEFRQRIVLKVPG